MHDALGRFCARAVTVLSHKEWEALDYRVWIRIQDKMLRSFALGKGA